MRQVDHRAVLGDDRPVPRHPGRDGQVAVGHQVPDLAVHRHHVARTDQVVDVEQLAGGGVAGDVHQRVALVHHVGAQPGQPVDHPVDRALVARDQRAGQHHRVAPGEGDHGMLPVGHPGQRRQRLALRPGGDDHHLLGPVLLDVAQLDQGVARAPAGSRGRGPRPCCGASTGRRRRPCGRAPPRRRAPAAPGARARRSRPRSPAAGCRRRSAPAPGRCPAPAVTKPGTSALVESIISRSTPSVPSRAKARRSVSRPSSGSWSALKSPVCRIGAGRRPHGHGQRVGDRVVDREELQVEVADGDPVALGDHPPLACRAAGARGTSRSAGRG